ncbi:MAG: hypothetical protein ACON4T_08090 [Synechococcus sp.]
MRTLPWRRWLLGLMVPLLLMLPIHRSAAGGVALAGPVDWHEVEATQEGRQWWDAGSVRRDRDGFVSVLSRYTTETDADTPTLGTLVVMQIDCDQRLFRDKQVNGLPRWNAQWEPAGGDGLIERVIDAVCRVDQA